VLLKGAYTVIADPEGRAAVLPFANPVLATAGSGDVLSGAIVAMLAQGLPAFEAAVCAAYLHGQAGLLILRSGTPAGAVAQDLIDRFPEALGQLYGVQALSRP
jgi:NAD(P)H-hydrate repair Nnr-like enzyme with NAD(P)H-hydrate dehydratase domain